MASCSLLRKMKKKQNTTSKWPASDHKVLEEVYRVLGFRKARPLSKPSLNHTQEGPGLFHLPAFRA